MARTLYELEVCEFEFLALGKKELKLRALADFFSHYIL